MLSVTLHRNIMAKINEIAFQDTFPVRHPVLREGKPIESCFFDGDDLTTTNHFGLLIDRKIIGVVSIYQNKNANFNGVNSYQVRGMAVLKSFQKKGFGELLMLHCEKHISEQNGDLIWFNAREVAVGFYEKLNYKKAGNSFIINDVGLHYCMFKKIG